MPRDAGTSNNLRFARRPECNLCDQTRSWRLTTSGDEWKTWDVFPGRYSDAAPESEHMEVLVAALSKKGAVCRNDWCTAHPSVHPNLARIEFAVADTPRGSVGVNLSGYDLSGAIMNLCSLAFANLSGTKLPKAKVRQSLINQSNNLRGRLLGCRSHPSVDVRT